MHVAAKCGYLDTFERLIEEGAKPELLNNNGENALHISVRECHFPIVNKIINYVGNHSKSQSVSNSINSQNISENDPVKDLINKQNTVLIKF